MYIKDLSPFENKLRPVYWGYRLGTYFTACEGISLRGSVLRRRRPLMIFLNLDSVNPFQSANTTQGHEWLPFWVKGHSSENIIPCSRSVIKNGGKFKIPCLRPDGI